MDHVVSAAANGSNHLANRVLSCAPCNEAEKRDADWLDFLSMKNSDNAQQFSTRQAKVGTWSARSRSPISTPSRFVVTSHLRPLRS